ncbi:MAG: hypothetical protein HRT44_04175, partial [Bdellovibrionales bacterium]|nr:hypothetical protein [Bdellovibrionales bacterium]
YNHNGQYIVGEDSPNEIMTLSAAQILFIHLAPNQNYWEVDEYGNDIKYKSLVRFENTTGTPNAIKMGMAFDVWFQYNPGENPRAEKVADPAE